MTQYTLTLQRETDYHLIKDFLKTLKGATLIPVNHKEKEERGIKDERIEKFRNLAGKWSGDESAEELIQIIKERRSTKEPVRFE
ncbi:MAG: hypothetical protein K2G69_06525 [Muribaculaceae bacterium]|nr:hypothetical protein [Muribaculaceae bacterium]MDE5976184.1 hypothetical protein [Muribaculaceae bacterium]